jgi:hypothetical protein
MYICFVKTKTQIMFRKKIYFLLSLIILSTSSFAQFEQALSGKELLDKAYDLKIYIQMITKDKLFLVNKINTEYAIPEFDYASGKINNNLAELDLNIQEPGQRKFVDRIKDSWDKLSAYAYKDIDNKQFYKMYFEIQVINQMIDDLINSLLKNNQFSETITNQYRSIQELRYMIEQIAYYYYAGYTGINQSLKDAYRQNVKKTDDFFKKISNSIINDNVGNKSPQFIRVIADWNFFKANLFHEKLRNYRTIFNVSTVIDYKLKNIKNQYLNN